MYLLQRSKLGVCYSNYMLVNYLTTHYKKRIDQGWGAFEVGNMEKAEECFRDVLEHEDDPHMHEFEAIEAHNGMAALSMNHCDLFDASRWYAEAKYLLDKHYHEKWPDELDWNHPYERAAMRTLFGLGHVEYQKGNLEKAKTWYQRLLRTDGQDELGALKYIAALKAEKKFEEA